MTTFAWAAQRPGAGGRALSALLLGTACVSTALAVVYWPGLVTGVVVGALLLALVFLQPVFLIALMLIVGPVDLSFMTGGFKALFPGAGGLDMNGIRLVGITAGFGLLVLADRDVLRAAFDRHARWYLLFLVYAAASLATTIAPVDGLRLLFKLAYPFLTFVVVLGLAKDEATLTRLMACTIAAAALITFVVNPLFVLAGSYTVDYAGFLRVQGLGAHENPFSFYLFAMLMISFARFITRWQWRYLVLCGGLGVWIVLTLTRITLLASLAGICAIVLCAVLATGNRRAVLAGAIVMLAVAVPLVPMVLERSFGYVPTPVELFELMRSPTRLYNMINWQGRQVLWAVAGQGFLADPLTGLGLGASSALLRENLPSYAAQVVHNEYVRLACELGIIGLALYFVAVLFWLIAGIRGVLAGSPLVREYAYPAVGGIIGWALIAITDNAFDYYSFFTQYIGFLSAGTLVALRLTTEQQTGDG